MWLASALAVALAAATAGPRPRRANGLGTFVLIVWWLALPIAAAYHPQGASTYSLCIGVCAAGGIVANLLLSRTPDRHEPILLCTTGWAVTALCIGALTTSPSPLLLQGISFVCGCALAGAALGFSLHAASLATPERNRLFQRDQVVVRAAGAAGAAGAVVGGVALEYLPHIALVVTAALLAGFACAIWRRGVEKHQSFADAEPPLLVASERRS